MSLDPSNIHLNDITRSDYSSLSSSSNYQQTDSLQTTHDFISITANSKPAQISVNDCGIDIDGFDIQKNATHCYSYELVFQQNIKAATTEAMLEQTYDSNISSLASSVSVERQHRIFNGFCGFIELSNGLLLLATVNGILGAINPQKSICKWNAVTKQINPYLPTNDGLYVHGEKKVIDLCSCSDTNEIFLLVKYDSFRLNKYSFTIETYKFDSIKFLMILTSAMDIPQLLFSQTGVKIMTNESYDYEFTRMYYDQCEMCFILLDNKHHKIYWLLRQNCHIRRCVKSTDGESMESPSGLVFIKNPKVMYVCNKKGLLICIGDRQPVTHDSLKPVDISYCQIEKAIYFIDTNGLYRCKLSENNENEQRYKKIFSNKNPDENKLFKRVIACKDHLFIMTQEANSIFVVERLSLKF